MPPDSALVVAPNHTRDAFDVATLPLIVRWAESIVLSLKADAIVACGHSGLLVAGALSYLTRIPTFAVRKPSEKPVADRRRVTAVSRAGAAKRWVWLDDIVGSGGTFRNAVGELTREGLLDVRVPVGILLYNRFVDPTQFSADDPDLGLNGLEADVIPTFGFRR